MKRSRHDRRVCPDPRRDSVVTELLTAREREVLDHVTRPHGSRAEAAKALGISPHTVRNHLAMIYVKLGVNSPAQALRVLDLA
jgi:DNA-binding CsgD family transcriptional regulator